MTFHHDQGWGCTNQHSLEQDLELARWRLLGGEMPVGEILNRAFSVRGEDHWS